MADAGLTTVFRAALAFLVIGVALGLARFGGLADVAASFPTVDQGSSVTRTHQPPELTHGTVTP